ncbi:hypothetical protein PR003_g22761 [Phytophthora rubi]|uniref:Uncharacterized protein n=1 Tax=Phytophthora rubi TaxID=129364 RepID=A0A6A3IXD5_9STRA|nr:hypothetical protein PR002_g22786 [Phytophthora rubi]KAE9300376.1 hypothetical protein PR003_g22761 [Phytophthora rubi]
MTTPLDKAFEQHRLHLVEVLAETFEDVMTRAALFDDSSVRAQLADLSKVF